MARVFGLKRFRFYENGVVGLNLPISEQVVGTRATRTTHPQVVSGFAELFSLVTEESFAVENPFLWLTKAGVVDLIGDAGCSHLIQHSVSCMHTHEQTVDQPHCGRCSQCVSRRFGTLASRYPLSDPDNLYRVELLTGERLKEKDFTLVESFIRFATDIGSMNVSQVVERYGEVGRVLRHIPGLSADEVAERIGELHRRHSREVTRVLDEAIGVYATEIRERRLPLTCAIMLAVSGSHPEGTQPESSDNQTPSRSNGDSRRTKKPSGAATSEPSSRGRRADVEGNVKIADVLKSFGNDWRKHLAEVCEALEHKATFIRTRKWKQLGCGDWSDVLAADQEGLVKALQHRLDWVAKHPGAGV